MVLSIIQLNANGLRSSDKKAGLLQWLRSLSVIPDVVCLQEVHCVNDVECQSWFRSSGFQAVVSPGSKKSCGCIVLFRPSLSLVKFSSDDNGRFVLCEFRFHTKLFRFVSLYAPNRNPARDQFFDLVPSWVDPTVPTVVCGDFNTVWDRSLDRAGSVSEDTSRESSSTPLVVRRVLCSGHLALPSSLLLRLHLDASGRLCLFSYQPCGLSVRVGSFCLIV